MKFAYTNRLCQFATVFALFLVILPAMAQEQESSEKNAAVVNGVAIPMEQYTKELNIQIDRVSQQGKAGDRRSNGRIEKKYSGEPY